MRPCASGTARRGHQCRLVAGSRHKIVQRGRMGLCPCAMIHCFGSSVSVASSICPASVCAQGVCKLPSAQSHTVFTPKCIVCAWCGPLSALLMRTANRRPGRYRNTGLSNRRPERNRNTGLRCIGPSFQFCDHLSVTLSLSLSLSYSLSLSLSRSLSLSLLLSCSLALLPLTSYLLPLTLALTLSRFFWACMASPRSGTM